MRWDFDRYIPLPVVTIVLDATKEVVSLGRFLLVCRRLNGSVLRNCEVTKELFTMFVSMSMSLQVVPADLTMQGMVIWAGFFMVRRVPSEGIWKAFQGVALLVPVVLDHTLVTYFYYVLVQGIGVTSSLEGVLLAYLRLPTFHVVLEATLPYTGRITDRRNYTLMVVMVLPRERSSPKGLAVVFRVPIISLA